MSTQRFGLIPRGISPQKRKLNHRTPETENKRPKKPEKTSQCNCPKERYHSNMICSHAIQWFKHIEERTDMPIDYARSVEMYEKVKIKKFATSESK